MTKLEIRPGDCGLSVMVTAVPDGTKRVKITIETDCEQVKALAQGIAFLTVEDILGFPFGEDKVYQTAKKVIRHNSCPVPCGIIKAVELEFGLAVKRDVLIHFLQ